MARTIYVCHCGSPRVLRDAYVNVNAPDDVRTFDAVTCDDCGYDGHSNWHHLEVPDDFDTSSDSVDLDVLGDGTRSSL